MKTPDEIKNGLNICANDEGKCGDCPYYNGNLDCMGKLHRDAIAYIERLEGGLEMWHSVATSPGAVEDLAIENNRLMARVAELEKQLADVNASPFDGGMSQQEYFGG